MMFRENHEHEPTCLRYEFYRGAEPRTYHCMESFQDFNGFMSLKVSPHNEELDFYSLPKKIELEWFDPIQGACDLPETNSQELPLNASELMKEYASTHPLTRQEWCLRLRN